MTQTSEAIRDAYRPVRPGFFATLRETAEEIATRRRLILYLVRADLKKRGADTVLGNVWWILDPLLTLLVYVILIAVIFRTQIDAYPLFVFCAILPWKWFSSSVADAVTCITTRERIIKQVNFPKVVLPMAAATGGVASFAFGLIPLFAMLVLLYRDVGNVANHVLRIWFYLSPALYGADQIADLTKDNPLIGTVFHLNPFATIFESYRDLIYHGRAPDWIALGLVLLGSAALLVVAVIVFRRLEPAFAKVI